MQTFLPYPDFAESAKVLDGQRLGKQRVEVLQLLNALRGESRGWGNHPAARMWRGHERCLGEYGVQICREWIGRGYKDTCTEKIRERIEVFASESVRPPAWIGNPGFHAAHRSNLLRKKPEHYRLFWPDEPDDLEYLWPV